MSNVHVAETALRQQSAWKNLTQWHDDGYYTLQTDDTGEVPVRLFLTPALLAALEDILYRQIVNATRFPGVRLVVVTPDAHFGYGVPVGSVILTDIGRGAVAMGPEGFDIGCGMMSARSTVPAEAATYERRLEFNRAVMGRVEMGVGGKRKRHRLGTLSKDEFGRLVRGGATYYVQHYGATFDRSQAERHRIPVDDDWEIPWGGKGKPERGVEELGSLGGGNHFIELQRCIETGTLFVQVHTGSRGFGHGLATNYFELAQRSDRTRLPIWTSDTFCRTHHTIEPTSTQWLPVATMPSSTASSSMSKLPRPSVKCLGLAWNSFMKSATIWCNASGILTSARSGYTVRVQPVPSPLVIRFSPEPSGNTKDIPC